MPNYQIDSGDMAPQPTEHQWTDYMDPLGEDGDGAPFYPRYNSLILRCPLELCGHEWYQYADGAAHSIYVPAPGTVDDFTTYTGVFVRSVKEGVVTKQSGVRGVEMTITGVRV